MWTQSWIFCVTSARFEMPFGIYFWSFQITLLDFQMNDERVKKCKRKFCLALYFYMFWWNILSGVTRRKAGKWKINIVLSSRSLLEFHRNSAMKANLFGVVLTSYWVEKKVKSIHFKASASLNATRDGRRKGTEDEKNVASGRRLLFFSSSHFVCSKHEKDLVNFNGKKSRLKHLVNQIRNDTFYASYDERLGFRSSEVH